MAPRRRDVLRPGARARLASAGALAWALWLLAGPARAEGPAEGAASGPQPTSALLWPTLTPSPEPAKTGELRLPGVKDGALAERAREVDATLADAAQDLGLSLDLSSRAPDMPRALREIDLVRAAEVSRSWIVSPRIERDGGELIIRIVAVPPGSKVALVREDRATPETLQVRVVVMLRDLVNAHTPGAAPPSPARAPEREEASDRGRTRAAGRAVLSVNLAAFGGYVGYALQKTSQNDDPRLLYPLMALGTGVGLGAATIIADEWDVGMGDAWYLAAGTWWPASSALLLASGYDLQPATNRPTIALLAGIGGTGVATVVLSQKGMGEGQALLAHSGAAFGTFVGGVSELLSRGSTDTTPYKGLGFGAAAGVVVAGAVATQVQVSTTRVLLTDLGASLGALGGAAAGSPFLIKNTSASRQRAWLGITLGGTVVGAAAALFVTRPPASIAPAPARPPSAAPAALSLPMPGLVTFSEGPGGRLSPVPGLVWGGLL